MEDKKNNLPSIPPNFVTLLELQERWIKEQRWKQNKQQQLEPEPKPQEQGGIRDVLEKSEVAVCLAIHKSTDKKVDSEVLKKSERKGRWKKWRNRKREARVQAETGAAEDEEDVAGGETHAPLTKELSVESRNGGRLRKMSTDGGRKREKEGPETKTEGAVCLISSQTTAKKREACISKKNQRKGEWKKVKEKKDEGEVVGGKGHALKTSGEKEEKAKSGNAVVADQTVEIEERLKDMSINGGKEKGNDKPARPNNGGYYRGGHRRFDNRRRGGKEWNPRNAEMIWVKKGDTSGCNAGEVQSSGCSLNGSA